MADKESSVVIANRNAAVVWQEAVEAYESQDWPLLVLLLIKISCVNASENAGTSFNMRAFTEHLGIARKGAATATTPTKGKKPKATAADLMAAFQAAK